MQWFIDLIRGVISLDVGYVDRGPITGPDFLLVDFTTDGLWHTLDLSGIVPLHAKAVVLQFQFNSPPAPGGNGMLSPSFHGAARNVTYLPIHFANRNLYHQKTISLDDNRTIEYLFGNVAWNSISCIVQGWWLHRTEF